MTVVKLLLSYVLVVVFFVVERLFALFLIYDVHGICGVLCVYFNVNWLLVFTTVIKVLNGKSIHVYPCLFWCLCDRKSSEVSW